MCGRVYIAPANPELRALVKEMNRSKLAERFGASDGRPLQTEGEILPSSVLPVLARNRAGEVRVFPMKWGFSQKKGLLINARAETAAEKPTFRESWEHHRCVIQVSWYYEWEHDERKRPGKKYALRMPGEGLIRLAGLYRLEEGLPAFVVLTCAADETIAWMHDRMPVMLRPEDADAWICPDTDPASVIRNRITKVAWEKAV